MLFYLLPRLKIFSNRFQSLAQILYHFTVNTECVRALMMTMLIFLF